MYRTTPWMTRVILLAGNNVLRGDGSANDDPSPSCWVTDLQVLDLILRTSTVVISGMKVCGVCLLLSDGVLLEVLLHLPSILIRSCTRYFLFCSLVTRLYNISLFWSLVINTQVSVMKNNSAVGRT